MPEHTVIARSEATWQSRVFGNQSAGLLRCAGNDGGSRVFRVYLGACWLPSMCSKVQGPLRRSRTLSPSSPAGCRVGAFVLALGIVAA